MGYSNPLTGEMQNIPPQKSTFELDLFVFGNFKSGLSAQDAALHMPDHKCNSAKSSSDWLHGKSDRLPIDPQSNSERPGKRLNFGKPRRNHSTVIGSQQFKDKAIDSGCSPSTDGRWCVR